MIFEKTCDLPQWYSFVEYLLAIDHLDLDIYFDVYKPLHSDHTCYIINYLVLLEVQVKKKWHASYDQMSNVIMSLHEFEKLFIMHVLSVFACRVSVL